MVTNSTFSNFLFIRAKLFSYCWGEMHFTIPRPKIRNLILRIASNLTTNQYIFKNYKFSFKIKVQYPRKISSKMNKISFKKKKLKF